MIYIIILQFHCKTELTLGIKTHNRREGKKKIYDVQNTKKEKNQSCPNLSIKLE